MQHTWMLRWEIIRSLERFLASRATTSEGRPPSSMLVSRSISSSRPSTCHREKHNISKSCSLSKAHPHCITQPLKILKSVKAHPHCITQPLKILQSVKAHPHRITQPLKFLQSVQGTPTLYNTAPQNPAVFPRHTHTAPQNAAVFPRHTHTAPQNPAVCPRHTLSLIHISEPTRRVHTRAHASTHTWQVYSFQKRKCLEI